ncbi:GNAT family N-acetyltransferase [Paenibacillus sp. FSL W8-0187]|uniref:GNAT family N-acetyltransferase n=1 Tax=Paenibacillus lautus TaxID=1401 RepID=A0A1R1AVS8_PAELA|nr:MULTISPECIES: GNAT family N-acetyltransferase [Paenibacillus]MBT2764867.1 GNAT family N-acetyltransferase [Paenibacillus sp. ISL-20]OME89686.1 GNAT family N-acetyltransferase [Paenibacillus lautus]
MNPAFSIIEVDPLETDMHHQLTELLIRVVENGASVGFLAPLSYDEAFAYWEDVLGPGVTLWVAVQDGQMIGTVQLQCAMKANGRHRAEVAKLMVDPASRRGGIGRALMLHLEPKAKQEGRTLLVLDTREGDPSNKLYQSLGYIQAGVIPDYAISSNGQLDGTVLYYKRI